MLTALYLHIITTIVNVKTKLSLLGRFYLDKLISLKKKKTKNKNNNRITKNKNLEFRHRTIVKKEEQKHVLKILWHG